ncbi:DNA polymerase III subunit epsilon [Candidatus Kinetoplastibacterium desouzaii TCC079E]|uniref:DNA polymerase III subunit epsilon n=1 Tax=Candidatus Kinetoplastidibacterium desouzai TCC079E TaxID=1208919 RepID=M1LN50_9PROT|nr:DNA polymerase III subunit epsilon [Candidatus Kinetoplastibacterium desouzaii]AGF47142.1 DNA polymerase III subunit epsilon [Candidatus Kinetoplastibacterium desouzaii TCC079E]
MRQVVFDLETTGLDVSKGHRIIEIGCVELSNRSITGVDLHLYVNPDREIDPGALAIHGLTNDFLSDKPKFRDIVDKFLAFIKGAEIIAHNASFDVKFLNYELGKLNLGNLDQYCDKIIDSLSLARELRPGKRNSLDALCDYYGVSNLERKFHGALLDSKLLSHVWLAMTRGQEEFTIVENNYKKKTHSNKLVKDSHHYHCPIIKATKDEINDHHQYLLDMKKNTSEPILWHLLEED